MGVRSYLAFCCRSSVNSASDNGPNVPILTGIIISKMRRCDSGGRHEGDPSKDSI